jgi:hypothetical protein
MKQTQITTPARWAVFCPQCEDELYAFLMQDVAERLADQHAYARTHTPEVRPKGEAR